MTPNILYKTLFSILGISLLFTSGVLAKDEIYTGFFSSDAIEGYDAVAYFTEGKPRKGLSKYKTSYKGANWYFSSAKNLAVFKNNPKKYAPQYGGYCAWAVANGYTAKGDPNQWAIRNGKLYLNYNEEIKNRWLADVDDFISKADANWPGVIQ